MNCLDHQEAGLKISQTLSAYSEVGDSKETIPYTDVMGRYGKVVFFKLKVDMNLPI